MSLAALVLVTSLASPALAKDPMSLDGTVELTTVSVNIVVGYRWGSGVLKFQDKDHPFEIDGLTVGAVGASKAQVSGDVFNLKKLEDFNGVYKGVGVNATIVGGAGGSELKNEHGVVLRLSRTSAGLQLQIGGDGVKLTLKDAK
jgi:hypothetical protein